MIQETASAKLATQATYIGSAGAIFFGLTANEVAALGGLGIAIIGLLVNIWFKYQHLKLAKKNSKNESDDE